MGVVRDRPSGPSSRHGLAARSSSAAAMASLSIPITPSQYSGQPPQANTSFSATSSHQQRHCPSQNVVDEFHDTTRGLESPESVQSTGFFEDSGSCATSYDSSSLQHLDRRRGLSPRTPTSSVVSNHDLHQRQAHNFERTAQERSQAQGTVLSADGPSTSEPLRGVWSGPPDMIEPHFVQNVVLGPPLRPDLLSLRRLAETPGPWTSNVPRYEVLPREWYNTTTTAFTESRNSARSPCDGSRKKARRQHKLTEQQKNKAAQMRGMGQMSGMGVCIRCSLYRESCDPGNPCNGCNRKFRRWPLGCVRVWLEDRSRHLFPKKMICRLDRQYFNNFKTNTALACCHRSRQSIPIRFTYNIGPSLLLWVREVDPYGDELINRITFQVEDTPDKPIGAMIQTEGLHHPPLHLDMKRNPNEESRIKGEIVTWVDKVLRDESDDVVWYMFWADKPERSEQWERELMSMIFEYFQDELPGHEALRKALRLIPLNHLMTHTLDVHEDDVAKLFQNLENPRYHGKMAENVSPRAVGLAVEALALPFLEKYAQQTLSSLQQLLLDPPESNMENDLSFCLSFICLFVLSKNQISVLEDAIASEKKRDGRWTMEEARTLIRKMEKELGDHIIALCQYSFRSRQKSPKVRMAVHSSTFNFFGRIQGISELHGPSELTTMTTTTKMTDLGDIDVSTFRARNTRRLLCKFYRSVLGDGKWFETVRSWSSSQ